MRPARRIAIGFVAALAVVAGVRRYLPDLLSPWQFEDDARQHVWWTYRFADPALFPDDRAADYFSKLTFAPPGYQALARAAVPFVDAQVWSEIVPFGLTAIVAVLAWMLGRAASGGSTLGAAAAGAFALLGGVLARVEGGLPRAWAMPVLLFGLWALVEKRWAAFGASLVAAALFYPPLVVSLGMIAAAAIALEVARTRALPRNWAWLAGLGAVALAILVLAYRSPEPDLDGPKVTAEVARAMPEFGPEGRSWFFSPDPIDYFIENERSGLGVSVWKLLAVAAALGLAALAFPGAVPIAAWLVPATSLLAFAAAHAVLFRLHLPSRYTRFTLPAFMLIWIGAIAPVLVARARRFRPAARALAFLERPRVLSAAAALVVAGLAVEAAVHARKDLARAPRPGYADCVAFLAGLPADTLIAAHPSDASSIPLLARRSVLASEETSTPYDLGYYAWNKERLQASLEACYATDWAAIDRLGTRYRVGAFMVDLARYAKPVALERVYFEPFRSGIAEQVRRGEREGFVLADPPPDRVRFRSGDFLVVRVRPGG